METKLLLQAAVQPGDSFIDIGANIGMITLLAARCVGDKGVVLSFEPNPVAFERLKSTVVNNSLKQVSCHQYGLADKPAEFTLRVVGKHTGVGTLAEIEQKDIAECR